MGKQSILRTIVDRNVERLLVREFLMKNTSKSGFGGLDIRRTPGGTEVTVHAERPGMVIGRKGKIINDLQTRLNQEFSLTNPKLKVEEVKNPTLNAQVMAEKIAAENKEKDALKQEWNTIVQSSNKEIMAKKKAEENDESPELGSSRTSNGWRTVSMEDEIKHPRR